MNRGEASKAQRPGRQQSQLMRPIMKKNGGDRIDSDLFESLVREERGVLRRETQRKGGLEEELYAERERAKILENEIELLEGQLNAARGEYRQKIESFRSEIGVYREMEKEMTQVLREKEEREGEIEVLRRELEEYKNAARAGFEFVFKCLETLTILPEVIQVDSETNDVMEFSFDEKKKVKMPKSRYIEYQIIKFIENQEVMIAELELEGVVIRIIDECRRKRENDKLEGKLEKDSKQKTTSGSAKKAFGSTNKKRSSKKVLADYGDGSYQESGYVEGTGNGSVNRSAHSSSGGKNNYSININLVVNDNNSESMVSEQNQSSQNNQNNRSFIKFFENELGCNKSEGSFLEGTGNSAGCSPRYDIQNKPQDIVKSVGVKEQEESDSQDYEEDEDSCGEESRRLPDPEDWREQVVAMYDYKSEKKVDLSMKRGDRVLVLGKSHTGWWQGQNLDNGERGYFPSNFVTQLT